MTIAVDFDGTIVEHRYPKIGNEILFAIDSLRALQAEGHLLILWTYRSGKELDEAVEFCAQRGLQFYAVNKNYPEEIFDNNTMSRKVNADLFIDDRNFGGLADWGLIYQTLSNKNPAQNRVYGNGFDNKRQNPKSFLQRIFG